MLASRPCRTRSRRCPSRMTVPSSSWRIPGIPPDHLNRNSRRDRQRRRLLQGQRFRRFARSHAATDFNRRARHPRADLQARQSLLADVVRSRQPVPSLTPAAPTSWPKCAPQLPWIEAERRRSAEPVQASDRAPPAKSARVAWGVLHGCRDFEVRSMRTAPQAAGVAFPGWWCDSGERPASERALDSAVVSERLAVVIANYR